MFNPVIVVLLWWSRGPSAALGRAGVVNLRTGAYTSSTDNLRAVSAVQTRVKGLTTGPHSMQGIYRAPRRLYLNLSTRRWRQQAVQYAKSPCTGGLARRGGIVKAEREGKRKSTRGLARRGGLFEAERKRKGQKGTENLKQYENTRETGPLYLRTIKIEAH
jgi:hypothetical protein